MLKSRFLVWGLSVAVASVACYFKVQLGSEALATLGVMLSVFFGFYISQLTILVGSSASRYMYEMTYEDRPSVRYLDTFIDDYRCCTHCCLGTVGLLFLYLVFMKQIPIWGVSYINAVIIGMTVVSLLKLKQMFDVMLQLMQDEAPYAPRATFADIDEIKRYRKEKKNHNCY